MPKFCRKSHSSFVKKINLDMSYQIIILPYAEKNYSSSVLSRVSSCTEININLIPLYEGAEEKFYQRLFLSGLDYLTKWMIIFKQFDL